MTKHGVWHKTWVVGLHAIAGWVYCGALIGVARRHMPLQSALVLHAVGAPIGFALISYFYFRRFAYTTPLQTALPFTVVVMGLDALIVAPFVERSFLMFSSALGTWIPFGLIFVAIYSTGVVSIKRRRAHRDSE